MGSGCSCCDTPVDVSPEPPLKVSSPVIFISESSHQIPVSPNGKTIVVHGGTFHADDSLAVYFLHQLDEYADAQVIRTREDRTIETADIVCDVGGVYDHQQRRYDHHQKDFDQTFPGSSVKLSSCGLIYLHYGRNIITNVLRRNGRDPGNSLEMIYVYMYNCFVKEIDFIDNNGQSQSHPSFTNLTSRVARLNPIGKADPAIRLELFYQAVKMVGADFEALLFHYFDSQIATNLNERTRILVESAYESRFQIDPSGQILFLAEKIEDKGLLFRIIIEFEQKDMQEARRNQEAPPKKILYVVTAGPRSSWCFAVKERGQIRKLLPCRGLSKEELSAACGIPNGNFVHQNGFTGSFFTKEDMLSFARYAVNFEEKEEREDN